MPSRNEAVGVRRSLLSALEIYDTAHLESLSSVQDIP